MCEFLIERSCAVYSCCTCWMHNVFCSQIKSQVAWKYAIFLQHTYKINCAYISTNLDMTFLSNICYLSDVSRKTTLLKGNIFCVGTRVAQGQTDYYMMLWVFRWKWSVWMSTKFNPLHAKGTKTYVNILCHSSTMTWPRWLKSFLK